MTQQQIKPKYVNSIGNRCYQKFDYTLGTFVRVNRNVWELPANAPGTRLYSRKGR